MASGSYSGDTGESVVTYKCDTTGIGYSVITDDIKSDFDFLITDIPNALEEVRKEIDSAAVITDAFYFENGNKVNDITQAYQEMSSDITKLNEILNVLHDAFMTDIDNVNAELQNNYGWVIGGYLNKKETKKVSE